MSDRQTFKGDHVRFKQSELVTAGIVWMLLGFSCQFVYAQQKIDFAHDILPILKQRCAECHTNGVFNGGLSLESRSQLLDSGAIDTESRHRSDLFERITTDDPDLRMPPKGDPLTAEQIEKVGLWIEQGLDWPAELSLKKNTFVRSLELPSVASLNSELFKATDPGTHPLDVLLDEYLKSNQLEYPPLLSNTLFARRIKMDLLGLLPSVDEVELFSKSTDPDRHQRLVDELLARDRDFADHWISFWNDLLRNDYVGTGYIDGGRKQITKWLHQSLVANKPYDQFVRELIDPAEEAAGFIAGIKWRGEVNASQIQALQFSQNVSQVFLGINMKCASCHDSFIDDWKLEDAYEMAAIISDKPLEIHRCDVPTGKFATSKFVFESLGSIDQSKPRKQRLAETATLLTSPDNGRFARTIVNRIWQRMMGRGLVHPVDIMSGEAWSEPVLDYLAADLVANGYDLKSTMRLIATSKIYRTASQSYDPESNDAFVFRGVMPKRLTAEQFVDAVWRLTDSTPASMNAGIGDASNEVTSDSTVVRASLVISGPLMRSLGRPNREQVVTTRPAVLSTLQALNLSNGDQLAGWLNHGAKTWLSKQVDQAWTNQQLIHQVFMVALSRPATDDEIELLNWNGEVPQAAVEDLLWTVVMLPELQIVK